MLDQETHTCSHCEVTPTDPAGMTKDLSHLKQLSAGIMNNLDHIVAVKATLQLSEVCMKSDK